MVPASRGKNTNTSMKHNKDTSEEQEKIYSMDEIWKDIDLLENDDLKPSFDHYSDVTPSRIWDYSVNSFWMMDGGQQEFWYRYVFPGNKRVVNRLIK